MLYSQSHRCSDRKAGTGKTLIMKGSQASEYRRLYRAGKCTNW